MNKFAKRGRGILLLLLGMLVCGSFAGCDTMSGGNKNAPITGTVWNLLNNDGSADDSFIYFTEEKFYFCRVKNGTYWSGKAGEKKIDDYTLSGNKLTLKKQGTFTVSVSGDIMTAIFEDGDTSKYKKVTSPSAAEVMAGAANTTEPT